MKKQTTNVKIPINQLNKTCQVNFRTFRFEIKFYFFIFYFICSRNDLRYVKISKIIN
jgi:hypothetical protein